MKASVSIYSDNLNISKNYPVWIQYIESLRFDVDYFYYSRVAAWSEDLQDKTILTNTSGTIKDYEQKTYANMVLGLEKQKKEIFENQKYDVSFFINVDSPFNKPKFYFPENDIIYLDFPDNKTINFYNSRYAIKPNTDFFYCKAKEFNIVSQLYQFAPYLGQKVQQELNGVNFKYGESFDFLFFYYITSMYLYLKDYNSVS